MNKKKIFGYLFLGLLAAGATGTVTSCKDYEDDINRLQEQITANANAIKNIEELIKSGSVIKTVTEATDGVTVTLSDGKSFTIKNGANGQDGTPGSVWTIGEDGYWVENGKKTSYYALGTKGEKGDKGDKGEKGDPGADGSSSTSNIRYYVPNAETGCFDLYEDGEKIQETNISWKSAKANVITAAMDKENLILTGVTGVDGGTVTISLNGMLKSLVFMPKNYLDGIETIIYPFLTGNTLKNATVSATTNRQGKKVTGLDDYKDVKAAFNYGPAVGYDYHMNPSNSNVKVSDLIGFNVLEPEVVYTNTRATANDLGVTVVKKESEDKYVFSNENGILHAGMQIEHPNLLKEYPTNLDYQKANTVALQVSSKDMQGADATITSDYALLQPQKAKVQAIYWAVKPMYAAVKNNTIEGDTAICGTHRNKLDVYSTPEQALQNKNGAALELYYENGSTLNIKNYLGIHALRQNVTSDPDHKFVSENWLAANGDEKEFGLTYKFKLVDYAVDGNATRDSRFAKWSDGSQVGVTTEDGVLVAQNLKADGKTPDESATAQTAIDREPLVQVTVTNKEGEVILDGYILIHITSKPLEAPDNKTISYESIEHNQTFTLCEDVDSLLTTWGQFNDIVLKNGLGNLEKENFDKQYTADLLTKTLANPVSGATGTEMKQFKEATVKGDGTQATSYPDKVGEIYYYGENDGTTNHVFYWLISKEEAEKLTMGMKPGETKDVVRYVRFFATQNEDGSYVASAKYPYIYIKFVTTLTRQAMGSITFAEKNNNYWFDATTGADEGTTAIILDVLEPRDGGNIKSFSRVINHTLVGNAPKQAGKYFVTPTTTTVTGQDEVVYTISGGSDLLIDKYDNSKQLTYTDATCNGTVNTYAIDVKKGVFANDAIYATPAGGTPVKIATLNQTTGELTLLNKETTKIVLNAVGYEANHANINKELRAWIGFVGDNGCGLATQVAEAPFLASWQRPINLDPVANQAFVDANTNGNYIYLADLLKFFDWRNEAFDMEGNNTWFMNFYGINAITVDVTPGKVYTDMNGGDITKTTLGSITTKARLYTESASGKAAGSHKFTFKSDFTKLNSSSQNDAAKQYIADNKAEFGYIYYENNGENVEKFNVKVPVTVSYTWGDFKTYVVIAIDRTKNN